MQSRWGFVRLISTWIVETKPDELKAAFERWMTRNHRPIQVFRQIRSIPSDFQSIKTKFYTSKASHKFPNNPVAFDRIHPSKVPRLPPTHPFAQFSVCGTFVRSGEGAHETKHSEETKRRGNENVRCDVVCSFREVPFVLPRTASGWRWSKATAHFCVIWRRCELRAIRNAWRATRLPRRRFELLRHIQLIINLFVAQLTAICLPPPAVFIRVIKSHVAWAAGILVNIFLPHFL